MNFPHIVIAALTTLLVAIGIILGIMLIAGYITFKRFLGRQKNEKGMESYPYISQLGDRYDEYIKFTKNRQEYFNSIEVQECEIEAIDGVHLKGYFLPAKENAKVTIICAHGYRSNCFNDFAGIIPFLHNQNYNVLFTVARAHVGSAGRYITLGKKESKDLVCWTEFIENKLPGQDIFIYGISLGAVNAMILTELDYIPSGIKGIIEDSGYSRAYDILVYQIRHEYRLSPYPTIPIANWFAKRIAGVNFKTPSPIESIKNSTLPILFIHGTKDELVPTYMGDACYKACNSPKTFLKIDDASHYQTFFENQEIYEEAFVDFVDKYSTKEEVSTKEKETQKS